MKKVTVFLTILMLSGCGGGGSGGSSVNTVPVKKEILFDGSNSAYTFRFDRDQVSQDFNPIKAEITLKDGFLYRKNENTPEFEPYFLTDNGLYIPESQTSYDAKLGVRTDILTLKSATYWQATPYNQVGLNDLQQFVGFRVISLANKQIAPVVEPYSASAAMVLGLIPTTKYADLKLPLKILAHQRKFSQGAKCLAFDSLSSNKMYYSFKPDVAINVIPEAKTLAAWEQQSLILTESNRPLEPLQTKVVGGYKVGWLKFNTPSTLSSQSEQNINVQYAIEFQGKVIRLVANTADETKYIDQLNTSLQNALKNGYPVALIDELRANLVDSCTYYNQAAMDDIQQAIQQAQSTETSITFLISDASIKPDDSTPNCYGGLTFC